jgi:hypothetical protein
MLHAAAVVWLPTAIAFTTVALGIGLARVCTAMARRRPPDDDSASDDGPGGSRRPTPRPPLPTGPVSWPEFEQQFAAYVERCEPRSARPVPERGSPGATTGSGRRA